MSAALQLIEIYHTNKNRGTQVVKLCVPFLFSFSQRPLYQSRLCRAGGAEQTRMPHPAKRKREYGMEESEPFAEGFAALVRFN